MIENRTKNNLRNIRRHNLNRKFIKFNDSISNEFEMKQEK